MTTKKIKTVQFTAKLKAIQEKLAKNRDELRDLVAEAEQILGDADEASESIERAIDALSRLQ